MIKAIVVEDDMMVAAINRQYLSAVPDIRIAGVFHSGKEALNYLEGHQVDLIILGIYMPGFTGLELLSHLRQSRCPAEVIMVTAANDTECLDIALKMGILDYLMQSRNEFSQETIDRMLGQRQFNREYEWRRGGFTPAAGADAPFPSMYLLRDTTWDRPDECSRIPPV